MKIDMQTELDGTESEISDLEQQLIWQRRYRALIVAALERGESAIDSAEWQRRVEE